VTLWAVPPEGPPAQHHGCRAVVDLGPPRHCGPLPPGGASCSSGYRKAPVGSIGISSSAGRSGPHDDPKQSTHPDQEGGRMTLQRMDNVGIVVESLDGAIAFFLELGLELEGRAMVEGEWAGRVTGLGDQRVEIAMMRTPDGHGRLELSRFVEPRVIADHRDAPVNALGYLRVMFAVDDVDDTLARLRDLGAQLVDEVVQYEDAYRLCYIRGPEGILIGLAEEIG
jgi:catechol 2,3-dioxygenase-like lactoylglutathione lyase family enzyme